MKLSLKLVQRESSGPMRAGLIKKAAGTSFFPLSLSLACVLRARGLLTKADSRLPPSVRCLRIVGSVITSETPSCLS